MAHPSMPTAPRSVRVPTEWNEWFERNFPGGNFSDLVVTMLEEFRHQWGERPSVNDVVVPSIRQVLLEKY